MENISRLTVLRFSLQLMICEAAFMIPRARKNHFPIRLLLALGGHFLAAYAMYALMKCLPGKPLLLNALFFLGIAFLTILAALACFEVRAVEMTFIATCGYALEHIVFAATRIVMYLCNVHSSDLSPVLDHLLTRFGNYMLAAFLCYFLLVKPYSLRESFRERDLRFLLLAITVMVAAVFLSAWYTAARETPETLLFTNLLCPAYSMICCLLIIFMEYFIQHETRLTLEKESMEQLMRLTEAQRLSTKESIDIINMRCHDLKHQMKVLLSETNNPENREYIESIRNAIDIYDSSFHTGNEALDYILYEKKLLARDHGVEFNCMADGNCLAFMQKADLYALLGNAIDNALERLRKEESGNRFLLLNIHEKARMITIHLENTCTETVVFEDGLPKTTKPDAINHGFGLRSIRFVTEKYGGELFMENKQERFHLWAVFPSQG